MRREFPAFQAAAVGVALIGLGLPARACAFRDALELPFPVLSDPDMRAYASYGLGRLSVTREANIEGIARFLSDTTRFGAAVSVDQDMFQLGGSIVVGRDGILRYSHRMRRASEALAIDDLLAAAQP